MNSHSCSRHTGSKAAIERAARDVMSANGRIRPGDEMDGDIATRWGLARVTTRGSTCLAVMEPCYVLHGEDAGRQPSMVLPRGACFVRRYDVAGSWVDVLDAPL